MMVPNDNLINRDGIFDSDISMAEQSDTDAKNDLIDLTLSNEDDVISNEGDDPSNATITTIDQVQKQQLPQHPQVLKTTDRLISDIVNDISMFELGFETGLLKVPTVGYADSLSVFLQNNNNDSLYKLIVINNQFEFAPSQQVLDDGTLIIRAILYKKKDLANPFSIPTSPLYNVKIIIKHDTNQNSMPVTHKNGFYCISDEELTVENRKILVTDYSQIYEDSKALYSKKELDIIEKAIPNVIDYANFISLTTKALMRIEISQGIFDKDALKNFEESEIQLRAMEYNTVWSRTIKETPSPIQCLSSLVRVLRGPLTQLPNSDIKTIRTDHEIPNVHVGIDLMENYFGFEQDSEIQEICPPSLNLPLLREKFITLFLEASFLSRSSLITFGDEKVICRLLRESVDFGPSQLDLDEKRQNASTSFIALSSTCKYSDDDIKELYGMFIEIDPRNSLKYFDYLEDIANQRGTFHLVSLVSRLKADGKMGYEELCKCYRALQIPQDNYEHLDDAHLLQQYISLLDFYPTQAERDFLRESLMSIAKLRRSLVIVNYLHSEPILNIDKAYDNLEVNESVDNDLIITALEIKKSDIPSEANLYDRSLLAIALYRKSFILLDYIEKKLPYLNKSLELDFSKSWEYLGVDVFANDFQIITVFQERIAKDPSVDIRVLRFYLRHIGKQKKSKLISEFLKKGIIEPRFLPVESSPVGLNNIGNTCYLNSLLQYYFVIEPLRSQILNFNEMIDEETFKNDEMFLKRRIGSRTVGFKETERSYQFVYQLRDLFEELIKSEYRCISPKKELAYLSFSPSTDEVEFQTEQEQESSSSMLLIPLGQLDAESLIVIDSSSSRSSPPPSIITVDSQIDEHVQMADDEPVLEDDELTPQSPVKRRLSTESCEKITSNKVAFKGRNESDEGDEMEVNKENELPQEEEPLPTQEDQDELKMEVQEEEVIPKRNTSATCHISADQMENALEMGRQQDVTECIQNVLFQLESAFSPHHLEEDDEQYDLIKELFYGKTKQTLQPFDSESSSSESIGTVRTKIERFLSLLVNIGDHPKDIYDALDTYFTEDLIKMDDGDVKRTLTITDIPKVLQIQIQRVQFDRERLMPVKSIEPIPFEEKLYMDRYMETDDIEVINKRKEVVEWKQRMSLLNMKKNELNKKVDDSTYNLKDGLTVFRNYLETNVLDEFDDLSLKPETVECLNTVLRDINTKEEEISKELEQLQNKIANQFTNFTKVGYSLFAIFIHRGEASYGHYWIYIKDPKRDVYRKYNDEMVTEVSRDEVFNFEEGNTATPYFLVYVKEDLENTFVDPLKREVETTSAPKIELD